MLRFFQLVKIFYTPIFSTNGVLSKNAIAIADKVTLFSVHCNQSNSKPTVPDRTIRKPRSNSTAGLSERPLTFDVTFFLQESSL